MKRDYPAAAVRHCEDQCQFDRLHRLAKNLLDPEMYGHAVSAEVRDAARAALGLPKVETV